MTTFPAQVHRADHHRRQCTLKAYVHSHYPKCVPRDLDEERQLGKRVARTPSGLEAAGESQHCPLPRSPGGSIPGTEKGSKFR